MKTNVLAEVEKLLREYAEGKNIHEAVGGIAYWVFDSRGKPNPISAKRADSAAQRSGDSK